MAKLCPKCGDDDLSKNWHPAGGSVYTLTRRRYYENEGVEYKCRGCGYMWDEKPLDAGSQSKPKMLSVEEEG